ncbi:MAG: peptidylprolyl isomerase [Pyrinomonadaceae bacterium]|nr:peptidylprolyl isomerase [Blastocatellia bacterium]MCW5956657.1 peptidylprolyl isomerase [Pyrinomonadaceae bacterium]
MKPILLTLLLLVPVSIFNAQIPLATQVQILKAEDARRYDKTLEDLMKSPNAAVRIRAALSAGRIGDAAAVPALVRMLNGDASEKAREMAAFALGEIESLDAADAIRIALGETARVQMPGAEKANVRGRLVEAAGKIVAANAQSEPRAAAGVAEKNKELKEAILFSLERELQSKTDTNKETILLALTAALRARPEKSDETIRKFLAFTDPDIVATALNTLTRLRSKNANRDARDLLETHTHAIVRANAARVLGAAEDKEAVDLLIKAATMDTDSRVRVAAIRSLATLKDAKAADPLLKRGEELLAAYSKAKKPNFKPVEQNEFIEVAAALGRILANTDNERADKLFADFGKLDKGHTPEVYIARIRVGPKRGDGSSPELTDWRQYSTLAQIVGEFAAIEPKSEVGKQMKTEAPGIIRPLAKAFAEADPATEGKRMMAGPDALQAFARFKTDDLGEVLRTALKNKDVQMRATAAGLIADVPPTDENIDSLNEAFDYAWKNDVESNDAILATLDALFKLDKKGARGTVSAFLLATASPDQLVRIKALQILKDDDYKNKRELQEYLASTAAKNTVHVQPFGGKGTKIGQILTKDADYRRALSRKNGTIRAVLTTQKGTFTIEFLPEDAPLTVDNFVKLARAGYFNGLEVHRVVPNFVMQDGDPRGDGNGGPGWSIRCEVNMIPYERGAVGMALSGKDTGGSQWFVTHSPQPHLDGGYTVFGRVNETGMKVVDKIVRGDKILSVRIIGR